MTAALEEENWAPGGGPCRTRVSRHSQKPAQLFHSYRLCCPRSSVGVAGDSAFPGAQMSSLPVHELGLISVA